MSSPSALLLQRVARPSLHSKFMRPEDTVKFFKHGQAIGWSGFSPAGYPKVVPLALADHVEKNKLQGKMQFDIFAGASVGTEVEDRFASLDMTRRRYPYISGVSIRKGINTGKIQMKDIHLSNFAGALEYGFFKTGTEYGRDPSTPEELPPVPTDPVYKRPPNASGKLDVAVIEVTEILPNGGLVLGSGIGIAPEIASKADKIILEVNTSLPSYCGLHDIIPDEIPPYRKPFLINRVDDRIGKPFLRVDLDKVVAVVESTRADNGNSFEAADDTSKRIADHLLSFFNHEVRYGRLPANLLPIQSGVGNIANAVIAGLASGPYHGVNVWTEVMQDTMLDYFDTGKLDFVSTAALSLSPAGFKRFYSNWDKYTPRLVIRPQQITNHPELVRRLGVIAMNTPVEVDIYAHANSTLVGGTKMVHGIGGSGDFIRNGYLTIMHTPSTRATKTDPTGISCIVPKASHIDHTEHDLHVVVTEQGLADVRGMSPSQRAVEIINRCAHPDYKPILMDYFKYAQRVLCAKEAGHEPQILRLAFKMYENLEDKGTMKVDKWY